MAFGLGFIRRDDGEWTQQFFGVTFLHVFAGHFAHFNPVLKWFEMGGIVGPKSTVAVGAHGSAIIPKV